MAHSEEQTPGDALPEAAPEIHAQPPEHDHDVRLGPAGTVAGGIGAVTSTLKHTMAEMGLVRGAQTLLRVNQKDGFDCPGCAWPDPDDRRAMTEFCENGAKAVAEEATVHRVDPAFFRQWSIAALSEQTDHWLGKQGRLTQPMIRKPGQTHYEPIHWDEAFALIGNELNALASPDEALFYTSGRTSNEAAFLYQLFVRQYGTNNLPDCSNMCHESSGRGLIETIGIGKGTVTLADFELADAIFVFGQNPGTNHPRMLTALQSAARKGCTIVHVNPLPEAGMQRFKHPQELGGWIGSGTALAKLFLQVRINGDVALLKGIMKAMLAREAQAPGTVLDLSFIEAHTTGFEAFAQALETADWEAIVEQSGISRERIEEAAEIACSSERIIVCWAMGLTQHKNGVANIQEIVNFLLMRGQLGKPGAGVCPVRGHSNVQGDRTMGIWEHPPAAFLDSLARTFDFAPPRHHGHDTVGAIKAMHEGGAKVFFALGGNFLSASPDTAYTAEALRRCRLTVHVSTKLNRAHLITGETALILPCLGRTEADLQADGPQFVTVENSMGVVHSSQGTLAPGSEHLLSEPMIVARLAEATLGRRSRIQWRHLAGDYDRIRALIEQVIPGFDDYNRRVRQPGGFSLPNPVRERVFNTPEGKAVFTVHDLPRHELAPDQYLMMTIRSHDQFNTTIYGVDDRYRGIYAGRRVILMHPEDLREGGWASGDLVDLIGHFGNERRIARQFKVVPYDIPRRCTATYFPEANVLVPVGSYADKSRTPTSKSVVISLQPAEVAQP